MDYGQLSLQSRQNGSPFTTGASVELNDKKALATHYSPGIAEPCLVIAKDAKRSKDLTIRRNLVAVISDGSAVLGLGNIGAEAALPVMEGKCMLLKRFGGVDAVPIVLDTQDTAEIIQTVKNIAPTFGGINLEDISAPRCFEIEQALEKELDIPVFHDDQDGTAMVTLAALINALKVVGKKKEDIKVCISGAGAAGIAIARMIHYWGAEHITLVDSKGIVSCQRSDINSAKRNFCTREQSGTLAEAIVGTDVFIGVSKPNIVTKDMIKSMNSDPIVFAMSNPTSEITPEDALAAGAKIVATGRSDYPNQINNVLIFPGFFRGLLDGRFENINYDMKIAAAIALAELLPNPTAEKVIVDPFDERVASTVSQAVINSQK